MDFTALASSYFLVTLQALFRRSAVNITSKVFFTCGGFFVDMGTVRMVCGAVMFRHYLLLSNYDNKGGHLFIGAF